MGHYFLDIYQELNQSSEFGLLFLSYGSGLKTEKLVGSDSEKNTDQDDWRKKCDLMRRIATDMFFL